MGKFGLTEILVILVIVVLLFGGRKIPELMKGLGTGIKEFKNAAKEEEHPVSKKQTQTQEENKL
jgi:sec-independent protein translocase protein TatA